MAERNQDVLDRMQAEITRDPDAALDDLQATAAAVDPAIKKLTRRQFNARYVLPLKRQKSSGKGKRRGRGKKQAPKSQTSRSAGADTQRPAAGAKRKSRPSTSGRSGLEPTGAMRHVFLDFARDLSKAESRSSIVEVLSDLDSYVARAIAAAGK